MNIEKVIPKLPMFDDFSQEEIHELFGSDGMLINYHDGDLIIRQGETGSALFVLVEGEVVITKNQAKDIELNTLKPGTFFGESPLVANSTRLTNVIAKGEVNVLKLDLDRFRSLNPAIVNKFHIQLNKILVYLASLPCTQSFLGLASFPLPFFRYLLLWHRGIWRRPGVLPPFGITVFLLKGFQVWV